jgi:two-component system LytT family response regulator
LLQEQIAIALQGFREKTPQRRIALHTQQHVKAVEIMDICYLQGDKGCTTVFLNGGEKEVTTKYLKDYEETLPRTTFLRTHHSYLINGFYIDRYHPKESIIYLKDTTKIPVSDRKKEMIELYFKTLSAL